MNEPEQDPHRAAILRLLSAYDSGNQLDYVAAWREIESSHKRAGSKLREIKHWKEPHP
jgi:hypothetical protein